MKAILEALHQVYESNNKPKFDVGDKVKINSPGHVYDKKTGKVTKVVQSKSRTEKAQHKYKVAVGDKAGVFFKENELSLAK